MNLRSGGEKHALPPTIRLYVKRKISRRAWYTSEELETTESMSWSMLGIVVDTSTAQQACKRDGGDYWLAVFWRRSAVRISSPPVIGVNLLSESIWSSCTLRARIEAATKQILNPSLYGVRL